MQTDQPKHSKEEIQRLYSLDYGDKAEFWFRMIGTLVGACIIWLYTGWLLPWIWVATYGSFQFLFFIFLRSKLRSATSADVFIAHLLFPCMLLSFIWMPVLMISSTDDVLSISGFTILTGVIVFVVRRSEEHLNMMLLEIGIIAVCLGVGVAIVLERYSDPVAWLGLIFGAATMIFYVSQAALIVRKQRLRVDELAIRKSHAEKLEAVGKLAGGVAHDFNNLLTVILGNLDLAFEDNEQASRNRLLQDARSATLRGAAVVRQLLSYARQTEGKPIVVQVGEILRSMETMCKTLIPASIDLTISQPEDFVCVLVDDALFITAMLNLVKNAVDAISGAGYVSINATRLQLTAPKIFAGGQELPAGKYVEFNVADTGHGISPAVIGRVLDPFFTTKPVGKGSGLGLAMVSGFAIQSGGAIDISSSREGTNVSLILPVATAAPSS